MSKVSKKTSTLAGAMVLTGITVGVLVFFAGLFLTIYLDLPSYFCGGLFVLSLALMIGIPVFLITNHNKEVEKRYKGMQIASIDSMTGIEFEQYLKRLLTHRGYKVNTTSVSGDLGVDLVASGDNDKIAIQAKRYNSKVSRRAISDAVAGMYHYGCNKAMVITNNYFSPGAIQLAQSTNCILIDRDTLARWINDYQEANAEITQPTKRYNA